MGVTAAQKFAQGFCRKIGYLFKGQINITKFNSSMAFASELGIIIMIGVIGRLHIELFSTIMSTQEHLEKGHFSSHI